MPSRKIVKTRTPGWCDAEFAHPGRISRGDRVLVTTYFASDEHCTDFAVEPLSRYRRCSWCLEDDPEMRFL